MRFLLRSALLLLTLALPVTLTLPATPNWWGRPTATGDTPADACARITLAASVATAADQGGCCHFAGGVCGCKGGRAQCCRGNVASSCPCSGARVTRTDAPTLRGPERDGPPLRLREVAFTDKTTGPPLLPMTSSKQGEPVWLWLELDCPAPCLDQVTSPDDPDLKLTLYWYYDPGSGPILRDDLKIEQLVTPRPPPPRTAIPITLPAGNWITEIGYGPDRICMKDDTTCAFRLRVTR
jgi:hypothetical protein